LDKLLTTKDVAEKLKVHINTVWVYILSGKLKASKLGGNGETKRLWRIKETDLESFINGQSGKLNHTGSDK